MHLDVMVYSQPKATEPGVKLGNHGPGFDQVSRGTATDPSGIT